MGMPTQLKGDQNCPTYTCSSQAWNFINDKNVSKGEYIQSAVLF